MQRYSSALRIWLCVGLFMVFMQIIIGGITRLTGSGLSITKWEIVTGTFPPMNAVQWEEEFLLYQETPQYAKINKGMSMSEFKFIYFWEYIHRLWARSMGFVFLIPFLIFWKKGLIDRTLMKRLGITILLAAIVAAFGWIMVASGLIERPWVNAYKLTLHLSLALILMSYLFYTVFHVFRERELVSDSAAKKWVSFIVLFLVVQIFLGGMMSGMKAALAYPTWPKMYGAWIPAVLMNLSEWRSENFVMYDQNQFMPALVQFLHRMVGYVLFVLIAIFAFRDNKSLYIKRGAYLMLGFALIQVILGIFTLIHSKGVIPVDLGVLHQGGAILLLMAVLYTRFSLK
jgi:cytochrome c oxidase assembly protein subunit 15